MTVIPFLFHYYKHDRISNQECLICYAIRLPPKYYTVNASLDILIYFKERMNDS
jgi:hypothetical protein